MAKPSINVNEEYNAAPMPEDQMAEAPVDETVEQDIAVSAEQLTVMKQLAADGNFEELGRLTAGLLTAAPEEPVM
jgi:hypothetical protein